MEPLLLSSVVRGPADHIDKRRGILHSDSKAHNKANSTNCVLSDPCAYVVFWPPCVHEVLQCHRPLAVGLAGVRGPAAPAKSAVCTEVG